MLQHWASEGEFNISGFVLLKFIELLRVIYRLNEFQQCKIAFVELAFTRPMLKHFLVIDFSVTCLLTFNELATFVHCALTPFSDLFVNEVIFHMYNDK